MTAKYMLVPFTLVTNFSEMAKAMEKGLMVMEGGTRHLYRLHNGVLQGICVPESNVFDSDGDVRPELLTSSSWCDCRHFSINFSPTSEFWCYRKSAWYDELKNLPVLCQVSNPSALPTSSLAIITSIRYVDGKFAYVDWNDNDWYEATPVQHDSIINFIYKGKADEQ